MGYKEELGSSQLKKLNEEDLDSKIQDISMQTNVPVYILGKDEHMQKLFEDIIVYFTKDD